MICKNCGSQIEDYSAFCQNCGSAVEAQPQPQVQTPANDYYAQPQAPVNDIYSQPVETVQAPEGAPYDAASYQTAKEYIAGSKTAKILSIVAVAVCAAKCLLAVGSFIPFLGIIISIVYMLVSFVGSPAAFVCAIISCVKLGKIKKIPEVISGSIDPQFFANYQNAQKGAKASKIMNIVYFVLILIPMVLAILALGVILAISIFDGGDLIEEILWIAEDIIEEIFYMIGF